MSPWIARIELEGRYQCTGTLIDRRWVLTAVHCVKLLFSLCYEDTNPREILVWVDPRHQPPQKSFFAKEVICYPSTASDRREHWPNDVMLIRLEKKVFGARSKNGDDERPTLSSSFSAVGPAVAVGWEREEGNEIVRDWAQTVELDGVSRDDCTAQLNDEDVCPHVSRLDETQFCAGSIQENVFHGLHNGDSGGPLVILDRDRPELVGIASKVCDTTGLTIYESVSKYRDWIVQEVCQYYDYTWGKKSAQRCRERLLGPADD